MIENRINQEVFMLPIDVEALRRIWIPNPDVEPNNQTIVRILEFLNTHPTFLQEHPNEGKPYLELLERVDLEKIPEHGWKTYSMLAQNYPSLFPQGYLKVPMVTINIGKHEVKIPKNHLLVQSEKFRKAFNLNLLESKRQLITLDVKGYDDEVIEDICFYLKNGQARINEDSVLDLYLFADEHDLNPLKEQCIDFIDQHLDIKSWEMIFDLATRTNNNRLIHSCMKCLILNREETNAPQLFEKARGFFDQHPHSIAPLLAIKFPGQNDNLTKITEDLSKEITITKENVLPYALLSQWFNYQTLSQVCTSSILQNMTIETFPEILQQAVDLGLKDLVWECLKFAKEKKLNLLDFESLKKAPYDDFAGIIQSDKLIFKDKPGEIFYDRETYPNWIQKPSFIPSMEAIRKLCSHFKVHLKIPFATTIEDLNELSKLNIPITSLSIQCKGNTDQLMPILNNISTLREFVNYTLIENFHELQEFASHFYPLNKESEIKLTGITLGKDINDRELEEFLETSPYITNLRLDSTAITKIPNKPFEVLACSNLSLEEINVMAPVKNIQIEMCKKIKSIKIKESKNIIIIDNLNLTSIKVNQSERIYVIICKNLKRENMSIPKNGRLYFFERRLDAVMRFSSFQKIMA